MIWLCMYTHVNTIIHMNTSTCSWVTISKSSFDDQIHTLDSSITYASKVHMLTKHNHIDIWKWRVDISKSRIPQFNPMSFWFSEHVLIAKSSFLFKSPWIFWLHSTDFFWLVKKKKNLRSRNLHRSEAASPVARPCLRRRSSATQHKAPAQRVWNRIK